MNALAINNAFGQVIEPEPIGYSFNTPGWYLVLGMVLLFAIVFVLVQYQKYKRNAYRREALFKIDSLRNNRNIAFEVNQILKIVAIQLVGREKVASLFSQDWFNFLNSTMKEPLESNFDEFSKAIYDSEYNLNEKNKNKLVEFAINWVKKHEVKNV